MKSVSRGMWAAMALLVVASSGCGEPQVRGSGQLVQEERQLPEFDTLSVDDGIDVTVVMDPSQPRKVRLVGDDNLLALLRTEVLVPGSLAVYFRPAEVGGWSSPNALRVEVTVPKLRDLSNWGGGTVDVSGSVSIPAGFFLHSSGGGIVRVRGLDIEIFNLDVTGGGDVTLEGRASSVRSRLSGGCRLGARELSVNNAVLWSSDGGSTEMRVSNSLEVTASGGGSVRIVGRPTVLAQDLSGGSTLSFE